MGEGRRPRHPDFDTELGRIAMTICMDGGFPESGRIPALAGADVICFPTNWLWRSLSFGQAWMARALENGIYFIAANRYGVERGVQFGGESCVISPDGTVQASLAEGNGIVYGTVAPGEARDKRWHGNEWADKLADRRPNAYGNITLNTYRWVDRDFHGLYGLTPLPVGRESTIAVAQLTSISGDFEGNLDRMTHVATDLKSADLIVFPELATCGPVGDRIEAEIAAAEQKRIEAHLSAIAARESTFLVAGIVEREAEALFNCAVVVGPEGILARYRKVHLTPDDRRWASAGSSFRFIDLPIGRLGLAIGYDVCFPETTTCLAIDGCDLIACPSLVNGPVVAPAVTGSKRDLFHLWRERARGDKHADRVRQRRRAEDGLVGYLRPSSGGNGADQAIAAGDAPGSACLPLDTRNLDTRFFTNPVRAKEMIAMRVPHWYDAIQAPHPAATRATRELLVQRSGDD